MLRNRSPRAVSSKKPVMADHHPSSPSSSSSSSPTQTPTFFGSPRLFRAFTHSEADHNSLISPTSILDTSHTTKPFPFVNPFSYDNKSSQPTTPKAVPGNKRLWEKPEAKGIGLALLDTLSEEKQEENNTSKASNGKVLFGTKLRVQIPPPFPAETLTSPLSAKGSANSSNQKESYNSNSPQGFTVSEMELSEDYTCVIARGPNPRTTHIFDNCIVESYYTLSDHSNSPSADFLSFCHTCKKYLEQKNDIFIYTGEKAFCSRECRYQEMLIDEVGNKEYDDAMRSCS